MHRNLIVLTAVIAFAACNSTPTPTASPNSSPSGIASSSPNPDVILIPNASTGPAIVPIPAPSASVPQSPIVSVITEQVGLLTVTHPVAWRLVAGPKEVPGRPIPLFYLSDAPLTVGPCPTPDPKSGEFQGCPEPLAALPSGGVLVIVDPNLGLPAFNPPQVTVRTATDPCHAIGGDVEMWSAVGGTVLRACLRGPDLAAHEAEVRAVIASLKPAA